MNKNSCLVYKPYEFKIQKKTKKSTRVTSKASLLPEKGSWCKYKCNKDTPDRRRQHNMAFFP